MAARHTVGWWSCGHCGHAWEASRAVRCPRCLQGTSYGPVSLAAVGSRAEAEQRRARIEARNAARGPTTAADYTD